MNRLRGLIAAPILALALVAVPTAAHAGGSDSPTPYAVTSAGITLPEGDTFPAHGHVNLTTSQGGKGLQFDPNNGHPGGAWVGQSFIPWSAFGLATCDTVSWVQIHGYNEHYGEGGQPPVVVGDCAPPEEPPADTPDDGKITICHATASETNPFTKNTVSKWAFYQAGHVDHAGDIFPAGSVTKGGTTYSWEAQGDQSLLAYDDCAAPPVDPPTEPVYELTTSHVAECGTVSISLRNVSPWLYRVLIETETAPGVWERVDGTVSGAGIYAAKGVLMVDNRGDAPDDQTGTYAVTFPEDSGTHAVRYKVSSGAEADLYAGLPVGEFTTVTVESDCQPPVVPEKPKAKKGVDFRADAICAAEPATGDLVTTLEKRAWTRDWVLIDNAWKLGEKAYGDWEVVESASIPWPKCQPDPLTGVEVRDGGPICVEPLDGTATVSTETRTWTQTASWNWKKGWVYGEVVYGDWEVETVTVEAEACAPPPADEPPAPPLETERLATTGAEGVLEGMLAAVAILLAGAGVIFGRIIWDRRAERRSREQ